MNPINRRSGAFPVAFSAICAALSVTVVAVGYATGLLDMSAVVVCGLVTAVLRRECGAKSAFLSVLVSTILIGVFMPDKTLAVLYFTAGGVYPIVRDRFARLSPVASLVARIITAELMCGAYVGAIFLFVPSEAGRFIIPVGLVGGLLIFLLYDVLLRRFEIIYDLRLRHKLNFK